MELISATPSEARDRFWARALWARIETWNKQKTAKKKKKKKK
jgi:hypothetical protein